MQYIIVTILTITIKIQSKWRSQQDKKQVKVTPTYTLPIVLFAIYQERKNEE